MSKKYLTLTQKFMSTKYSGMNGGKNIKQRRRDPYAMMIGIMLVDTLIIVLFVAAVLMKSF